MDGPIFLHAAHQVRQAFDGLRAASWLAIGLAVAILLICWGRIVAWFRTPEPRPVAITRWGRDDSGWYFELSRPVGELWEAEAGGTRVRLRKAEAGLLRPEAAFEGDPQWLVSERGDRLRL